MRSALDLKNLAERLLKNSTPFELVQYIFITQGAEWRHLDYEAAARCLSVDRRTISRAVKSLAEREILLIRNGFELRINDALIKQKAS